MKPTVTLADVHHRFRSTRALDAVTAGIEPGITGLLGPNGSGKTTLLRIVATALRPKRGTVRVLGENPTTPAGKLAIRRQLGYLNQEPGFYTGFTAYDFVDYVAILKEMPRAERRENVGRVLDGDRSVGAADAESAGSALDGTWRRRHEMEHIRRPQCSMCARW